MQNLAQHLISLRRTILLAGLTAFWMTAAVLPAGAQSSPVQPAVNAAKVPHFLSPPGQGTRRGAPDPTIYDNGPINGQTYAWLFNFEQTVSDTFTTTGGGVTGITFGAWMYPADVLESAEISITSQPNGGTVYFDATIYNFSASGCVFNSLNYYVCTETSSSFQSPSLPPGTYWVNLKNALVSNGDPVYWDQNSGAGCTSPGCPSRAVATVAGGLMETPSESFTLTGNNEPPPQCYDSHGNLQIISNFTEQQTGSGGLQAGVVADQAGNLYGAFPDGGSHGVGFVFRVSPAPDRMLDPLFTFSEGDGGSRPTGLMVGPNGTLYGGAQGGIRNCGSHGIQYCGLVFNLTPPATPCRNTSCSWNENVSYRFTSESDGAGVINVSAYDQQGNLYGTTTLGGANDAGTVFELTPSGGSWTKTILYNFAQGQVSNPTQILVGNDGNLYGITNSSLYIDAVVFQLVPSNGQWTLNQLYWFAQRYGTGLSSLVQDSAGNLYGILPSYGTIFVLSHSGSGWSFYSTNPESANALNGLTIDANGNLFGTGVATVYGIQYPFIYEAAGSLFNIRELYDFNAHYFPAGGSLALDSGGNLYGTTSGCGTYNSGTVWQLSP